MSDASAGKYDEVLRPFLALMERELHANSSKGDRPGWLSMTPETCLLEIYWHVSKLSVAVRDGDPARIAEHAADVANMAMMQADIHGVLSDWKIVWRDDPGGLTRSPSWDAAQIKQPGWNHVQQAFVDGAREARANPAATDEDFGRASDGHTKRIFEAVDPDSEQALRTESWVSAAPAAGVTDDSTPGQWFVRKRERNGELLDCFVAAPDFLGLPYDAEILGDDEYRDGKNADLDDGSGLRRKLADCELIVKAVTFYRAALAGAAQDAPAILPAQAAEALDELEASARGDEPYNHFAGAVIRRYLEEAGAAQGAEPEDWVPFSESAPPTSAALDDPTVVTQDAVLVTNNLHARDRMGRMSHLWLAAPINGANGWVAFDDADRCIEGLTHWRRALAAFPQPTGTEKKP